MTGVLTLVRDYLKCLKSLVEQHSAKLEERLIYEYPFGFIEKTRNLVSVADQFDLGISRSSCFVSKSRSLPKSKEFQFTGNHVVTSTIILGALKHAIYHNHVY